MSDLKPCPCGAADPRPLVADRLLIHAYAWVVTCGVCKTWAVSFIREDSTPVMDCAYAAWNAAPPR